MYMYRLFIHNFRGEDRRKCPHWCHSNGIFSQQPQETNQGNKVYIGALYPTPNDIQIYQVMLRRFWTCGGNFYRALDTGLTIMVDIFKKTRLWYLTIWCLFIQIDALYLHCAICMSNNDGVADCTGTRKPCVWVFTPSAVIRTVFVQSCTQKIYPQ